MSVNNALPPPPPQSPSASPNALAVPPSSLSSLPPLFSSSSSTQLVDEPSIQSLINQVEILQSGEDELSESLVQCDSLEEVISGSTNPPTSINATSPTHSLSESFKKAVSPRKPLEKRQSIDFNTLYKKPPRGSSTVNPLDKLVTIVSPKQPGSPRVKQVFTQKPETSRDASPCPSFSVLPLNRDDFRSQEFDGGTAGTGNGCSASLSLLQPRKEKEKKYELDYKRFQVRMGDPLIQNEKSSYGTKYQTVYKMTITFDTTEWDVFKKHTEFDDFHNALLSKFGMAFVDFKKIEESMSSLQQRKQKLEKFIEGVMYFNEVLNSDLFKEFIQFDKVKLS